MDFFSKRKLNYKHLEKRLLKRFGNNRLHSSVTSAVGTKKPNCAFDDPNYGVVKNQPSERKCGCGCNVVPRAHVPVPTSIPVPTSVPASTLTPVHSHTCVPKTGTIVHGGNGSSSFSTGKPASISFVTTPSSVSTPTPTSTPTKTSNLLKSYLLCGCLMCETIRQCYGKHPKNIDFSNLYPSISDENTYSRLHSCGCDICRTIVKSYGRNISNISNMSGCRGTTGPQCSDPEKKSKRDGPNSPSEQVKTPSTDRGYSGPKCAPETSQEESGNNKEEVKDINYFIKKLSSQDDDLLQFLRFLREIEAPKCAPETSQEKTKEEVKDANYFIKKFNDIALEMKNYENAQKIMDDIRNQSFTVATTSDSAPLIPLIPTIVGETGSTTPTIAGKTGPTTPSNKE